MARSATKTKTRVKKAKVRAKAKSKKVKAKPKKKVTARKRVKSVRRTTTATPNRGNELDVSPSAVRLKALRKEAGLSVRAMAKALNMGATTYQHYEDRYKKRYLPFELVKPASEILKKRGVTRESVDALSPKLSNVSEDVVSITYAPLISWVQAGELAEVVDPYAVGDAESEIAIEYDRDSVLGLRVRGSSLNRVAPDGSIVIVDYSTSDLVAEKFYVVRKNGEATVKRYMPNPDRFEPFSTEPDHPIVFPSEDFHVVGRVIRVVTEL